MYGVIVKLMAVAGARVQLIALLGTSSANMPGCVSYTIATDASDENVLWVTEIWDCEASHDASLALPAVKAAIPMAKSLVARLEKVAITLPVWGVPAARRPMNAT
jgi:quinol monooxygenase YgiN